MARPLWAEQDPNDWWHASEAAIRGVLGTSGVRGSAIASIGLTGQMHGLVLLDLHGKVIRPALIWCDQRSQTQVEFINPKLGPVAIVQATANPMLTGWTLPKLLWIRDHEPDKFAQVRKILLPKDYIRYKLTGEYATDVSDASGTGMFDVVNRQWALGLVDALGLDRSMLPKAVESSAATGEVSAAAARATGLIAGTRVVGGAGDQAASAVGNGIVAPGTMSCTVGTSGVVFAYLQKPAYDPEGRVHTFCHAIPHAWHVMGVTQGAGLSLQWFRNRFAPEVDYPQLTAEAESSPPGAQGLFWLPYLMGERTPHLDALARGAWIGLTAKHTRADLARSVLEGVCYSLNDGLEIIRKLEASPSVIRLSGGGAKSPFWHQIFTDIFNVRVTILETQEGSAYGAALLALAGTEAFGSTPELVGRAICEVSGRDPDAPSAQAYARRYAVYRSLYPALQSSFRAIGALDV